MINLIQSLISITIAFGLFFTPSIVAAYRRHRQFSGIVILNVLLGWTFIGWIAALIWAVIKD